MHTHSKEQVCESLQAEDAGNGSNGSNASNASDGRDAARRRLVGATSTTTTSTTLDHIPPWVDHRDLTVCGQVEFGTVAVGTNNLVVPSDQTTPPFTHFLVYGRSALQEQTTPHAKLIYDAFASASALDFVDKDLDIRELGGQVYWTAPASMS